MKVTNEYVFDFLQREAAGIAEIFGSSCETLIHDMTKPGFPILAIYNGHVSGRRVGSKTDIYGGHTATKQLVDT
ncbi:PAS domain-containing protein, partial [Lachnospiraceae bacterium OttesenSCG-928-E19]|nr:PAS domain-containing protein [Lachnospiraceae bacterium OttesenSCG-928-E19]